MYEESIGNISGIYIQPSRLQRTASGLQPPVSSLQPLASSHQPLTPVPSLEAGDLGLEGLARQDVKVSGLSCS